MEETCSFTAEDADQLDVLCTSLGEANSGRARYGAAMYFYQRGMISAESLEVYRSCSPLDRENPVHALKGYGVYEEIEKLKSSTPTRTRSSS